MPSPCPPYQIIYKIVDRQSWQNALETGQFEGVGIDRRDGYIHFSTERQLRETARRHFAGIDNLLLVGVAVDQLGDALTWEPSRDGELFPHLYGVLPISAVVSETPLPWDAAGYHRFPDFVAEFNSN